jgi:hypothetical protein
VLWIRFLTEPELFKLSRIRSYCTVPDDENALKVLQQSHYVNLKFSSSVADPGCLSRIPDPDFYPSRIPDPGSRIPDPKTATKERDEKKFDVIPFYVATNFTKLYIILV